MLHGAPDALPDQASADSYAVTSCAFMPTSRVFFVPVMPRPPGSPPRCRRRGRCLAGDRAHAASALALLPLVRIPGVDAAGDAGPCDADMVQNVTDDERRDPDLLHPGCACPAQVMRRKWGNAHHAPGFLVSFDGLRDRSVLHRRPPARRREDVGNRLAALAIGQRLGLGQLRADDVERHIGEGEGMGAPVLRSRPAEWSRSRFRDRSLCGSSRRPHRRVAPVIRQSRMMRRVHSRMSAPGRARHRISISARGEHPIAFDGLARLAHCLSIRLSSRSPRPRAPSDHRAHVFEKPGSLPSRRHGP